MSKVAAGVLSLVFAAVLVSFRGSAASGSADITMLQAELRALRQSQQAMAKDIAEIKMLLEPLRAPPPIRAAEGRIDASGSQEKGNARASVVMIEFSDFQCPFCKRHVDATLPKIEEAYIDTGKIRYVFMDYPLESIHPQAFKAAEAAHCAAEQKQYWRMHDRLFANQEELARDQLVAHAGALGLDKVRFATCLDSGKHAGRIKASLAQGEKLGIDGTPAVILGRQRHGHIEAVRMIVGSQPFEVLKSELDRLLADTASGG
jgi:protein-disulfide isomerase